DPFAYDAEGSNYFDLDRTSFLGNHALVVFDEGEQVSVAAGDEGVRFLFVTGRPLNEPVAWYGPIVMNTNEELETAFRDLRNNTFIK
ncbi:MAG: pirin-like C-terminal cupin domain-containing protein, partial [Anaerolineaceae bacterium]